jgi:hypothetical protein
MFGSAVRITPLQGFELHGPHFVLANTVAAGAHAEGREFESISA